METPEVKVRPSQNTIRVDPSGAVVIVGIWAWIFTIGFLHLTFWKAVLAIVLWPFYLGLALGNGHDIHL